MAASDKGKMRLLIVIFYESPWERIGAWFLGIRRDPSKDLRWTIPRNPTGWRWLFGEIAAWTDKQDQKWITRYASSGKKPHPRWRR
jgi:hypothetical protein